VSGAASIVFDLPLSYALGLAAAIALAGLLVIYVATRGQQ
jgi:hypothetical protein